MSRREPAWGQLRRLQGHVNRVQAHLWFLGGGEPQWFGTGATDAAVVAPDPLHLAALRTMGHERWNTTPPAEGADHPEMPHSAEQETPMAEPDPSPEDYRDAWCKLLAKLEGHVLATREHAKTAMDRLAYLERQEIAGSASRHRPAFQAQAWAAQRLLDDLRELVAPPIPVDDEKGQGSILELVPDAGPCEHPPLRVQEFQGMGAGSYHKCLDCGQVV